MSHFLREIYEQPDALRRTIEHVSFQLTDIQQFTKFRQITFTGMGSSYGAACYGANLFVQHGMRASAIEASELLYYDLPLLDEDTVLVVISQSGRTGEIVRLFDCVQTPMIAITNDPASPLALASDTTLTIQAGTEHCVSSKTYTCTLAALYLLGAALAGDLLSAASTLYTLADLMERHLPRWDERLGEISAQRVVFIGRGPSYTSAVTGALMCQEADKLPAEGISGGQFRHGYIESLSCDTLYVIFAAPGCTQHLNLRLARDIRSIGGRVIVIGNDDCGMSIPAHDEWTAPLLEIVPAQLLAARLSATPDTYRFGQKVTTQE
jgi:glutamine---fructose-6-phosphate transaminase (isomerizing)